MGWFNGTKRFVAGVLNDAAAANPLIKKAMNAETIMEANKTILKSDKPESACKAFKNSFVKNTDERMAAQNTARIARGEKPLYEVDEATENYGNLDRAKSFFYNGEGKLSKKRIAAAGLGAYAIPATAGRIASGGGLYRDSDGNFDLMGIPIF